MVPDRGNVRIELNPKNIKTHFMVRILFDFFNHEPHEHHEQKIRGEERKKITLLLFSLPLPLPVCVSSCGSW